MIFFKKTINEQPKLMKDLKRKKEALIESVERLGDFLKLVKKIAKNIDSNTLFESIKRELMIELQSLDSNTPKYYEKNTKYFSLINLRSMLEKANEYYTRFHSYIFERLRVEV